MLFPKARPNFFALPQNPPPTYPKEPLRQKRGAIKEGKFSLFTTFLLPFHSVASSSSPPNEKGSWVQQPAVERKEEKRSGKVPGSRPFPATSCNEEEEKWVGQLLFFFFGPAHEPSSPAAVTALGGGIPPPYRSSSERPPSQPWGLSGEKRNINERGGGMNVSYASILPSLFRDKGRDKTGEEKVNEQQARICQLVGKVEFGTIDVLPVRTLMAI